MRKSYATDLSDSEWSYLRDQLSELPKKVKTRTHSLRDIFDVLRSGCHWRLLPHDFPPWQTVFYHFRRFRLSGMWHLIFTILRGIERGSARTPTPPQLIMDSQSIKTTEECRENRSPEFLRCPRQRLRRSQEREGQEATPAGRYPGTTAFGLRQPGRYPRQGRSSLAIVRTEAAVTSPEEDMGGRSL